MNDFEGLDTLLTTDGGGMYSSARIDKVAEFIVDKLTDEKMNYEEAILVLRSSEQLLGVRAKLEKPTKDF